MLCPHVADFVCHLMLLEPSFFTSPARAAARAPRTALAGGKYSIKGRQIFYFKNM
jgi:hypothetical protein